MPVSATSTSRLTRICLMKTWQMPNRYTTTFLSHTNTLITAILRLCRSCAAASISKNCSSTLVASRQQSPIAEKYGDAAFERDLPITKHIPADKVHVLYPKHLNENQGISRAFQGSDTLDLGNIRIETVESGENQTPDIPTNGYLITHIAKNVSILHTGDLHEPYPALANLQGKVDFLIHMKLGLGEGLASRLIELIELIQPRFMIPTHYRTDRNPIQYPWDIGPKCHR